MSKATPALLPLDPLQRYTVEEAISYLRTSRWTFYNVLVKDGQIKTIKHGKRTFVPGTEIARLSSLSGQAQKESA